MALKAEKLYNALLQSGRYQDIGSSASAFQQHFSSDENAAKLYDIVKNDGGFSDFGSSLDVFRQNFGLGAPKKAAAVSQPSSPAQPATASASPSESTAQATTEPAPAVGKVDVPVIDQNLFFGRPTGNVAESTRPLEVQPDFVKQKVQMDEAQRNTDALNTFKTMKEGDVTALGEKPERSKFSDEEDYLTALREWNKKSAALNNMEQQRASELTGDVIASGLKGDAYEAALVSAREQAAQERKQFADRFYKGELTESDIAAIKRANPVLGGELKMQDAEVAQLINNKTLTLKREAENVRALGNDEYAKHVEGLDNSIESLQEKIEKNAGTNYIYSEGGVWKTAIKDYQYMADETNQATKDLAYAKAQKAYVQKQHHDDEYQSDYQEFQRLRNEAISAAHGGKSVQEIMRLVSEGKDTGGPLKGGIDGKLSPESAEWLSGLVDNVITSNNLRAIQVEKHGTETSNSKGGWAEFWDTIGGGLRSTWDTFTGNKKDMAATMLGLHDSAGKAKGDFVDEYKSTLGELNYGVRGENAVGDFRQKFLSGEGAAMKPLFDAQERLSKFYSSDATRTFESALKTSQDAAVLEITDRYSKLLDQDDEYNRIRGEWGERVRQQLVSPDIAYKHIEQESRNNEKLRGLYERREREINSIRNKTNAERAKYMIDGMRDLQGSGVVINPDGTIGVKGMAQEQLNELAAKYDEGTKMAYADAIKKVDNIEGTTADVVNMLREQQLGAFNASFRTGFGEAGNSMMKQMMRWMYHKTGQGQDALRYFQSEEESNVGSVGKYAADHFRYKGMASLIDPSFYGYASGQSAPYMAPTIVAGLATGGSGAGVVAAGIIGGVSEAAQNSLATYDDVYTSGVTKFGAFASTRDASRAAAKNFSDEVLPNVIFQSLEFGTLLRAERAVKPLMNMRTVGHIASDIGKSAVMEGVQEGVQGLVQENARRSGVGEDKTDLWDYMQTDDFRQNFMGGLAGGLAMGGAFKAKGVYNEINNWKELQRAASDEVVHSTLFLHALSKEQDGNGGAYRDQLRLRLLNNDYKDEGEKKAITQALDYSTRLVRAMRAEGVQGSSDVNKLYAVHNMALSDMLSEQASKEEGARKKLLQRQSDQYRDNAADAFAGKAQIYALEHSSGSPIFLSKQAMSTLAQEGVLKEWKERGIINGTSIKNDEEAHSEVAQHETPATPEEAPAPASENAKPEASPAPAPEAGEKQDGNTRQTESQSPGQRSMSEPMSLAPNKIIYFGEDNTPARVIAMDAGQVELQFDGEEKTVTMSQHDVTDLFHDDDSHLAPKEEAAPAAEQTLAPIDLRPTAAHIREDKVDKSERNSVRVLAWHDDGTGTYSARETHIPADMAQAAYERYAKFREAANKKAEKEGRHDDVYPVVSQEEFIARLDAEDMNTWVPRWRRELARREGVKNYRDQTGSMSARLFDLADRIDDRIKTLMSGKSFVLPVPPQILSGSVRMIARLVKGGEMLASAIKKGYDWAMKESGIASMDFDEYDRTVRQLLNEKPKREAGESMSDYSMRVLEWRKQMLNTGTAEQQQAAQDESQNEVEYIQRLNEGIEALRANMDMTMDEFNQKMGEPQGSFSMYVAALKYLQSSNKQAGKIIDYMRKAAPRKMMMTEVQLLKMKFAQMAKGSKMGFAEAREQLKAKYKQDAKRLEASYADQKQKDKARHMAAMNELKDKHARAMEALERKYQGKIASIAGIRAEVEHMLSDYNEIGAFEGVKYSAEELMKLANMVNLASTERGFDNLQVLLDNMMTKADYGRNMNEARAMMRTVREIAGRKNLPANLKDVFKSLISLNPMHVQDIAIYKEHLREITEGWNRDKSGAAPQMDIQQMQQYVKQQQSYDIDRRIAEVKRAHAALMQHGDVVSLTSAGALLNMPEAIDVADVLQGIRSNAALTYAEKVQQIDRMLNIFDHIQEDAEATADLIRDPNNLFDPATATPLDYNEVAQNIDQYIAEQNAAQPKATPIRTRLERQAKHMQALIRHNPNISAESNEALDKIKQLDVTGWSADDLRMLMNVIDNISINDDLAGSGKFLAKHTGLNVDKKAFFQWLDDKGFTIRAMREHNTRLGDSISKLKEGMSSTANVVNKIANNAPSLAVEIMKVAQLDRLQDNFARAQHRYHALIEEKFKALAKTGFDLSNAQSNVKLTMHSWLMQFPEGASEQEKKDHFTRRVFEIRNDIARKESSDNKANQREAKILRRVFGELQQAILNESGIDIMGDVVAGLDHSVMERVSFLTDQEKAAYDIIQDFNRETRPEYMDVAERLLNKRLTYWANYSLDATRKLDGSVFDFDLTQDTFAGSILQSQQQAADGSFNERIEPQRFGANSTRAIDYRFFRTNASNAKAVLFDIHTLENRMVSNEVLNDKDIQERFGSDNIALLKKTMLNEARAMTGIMNRNESSMSVFSDATRVLAGIAGKRQLYKVSALLKQGFSAYGNTMVYLDGVKSGHGMYVIEATKLLRDDNAHATKLLEDHLISLRSGHAAGSRAFAGRDINDERPLDESWWGKAYHGFVDWSTGTEKLTGEQKKLMGKFLEVGDVYGAKSSWLALYAHSLVSQGKYADMKSVDWATESANPDRTATAFAEHVTSKMLNANSRSSMGTFYTDQHPGAGWFRATVGLFGSFGWNKSVTAINAMQGWLSKDVDPNGVVISDEQRQEEKDEAYKVMAAGLMEDIMFQGIRMFVSVGGIGWLGWMLMGALAKEPEDEGKCYENAHKAFGKASEQLAPAIVSNYFFSWAGSNGQELLNEGFNGAFHAFGYDPKKNFFYQDPNDPNHKEAGGIWGAAMGNQGQDFYRVWRMAFKHEDRFGGEVPAATREEMTWGGLALVSDVLQGMGRMDGDINNMIQKRMKQFDRRINKRFKDDFWINAAENSKPGNLSVSKGDRRQLTDEQGEFYHQNWQKMWNSVKDQKWYDDPKQDKDAKLAYVRDFAKQQTLAKFPGIYNNPSHVDGQPDTPEEEWNAEPDTQPDGGQKKQ